MKVERHSRKWASLCLILMMPSHRPRSTSLPHTVLRYPSPLTASGRAFPALPLRSRPLTLTSRRQATATRRISTSPMMPSASAAQKQSFGQIWRLSNSCKSWSLRAYRPARSSRKSSPAMWAGAVLRMPSTRISQTGRTSLQSCTPHFPRRNTLPPVRPR